MHELEQNMTPNRRKTPHYPGLSQAMKLEQPYRLLLYWTHKYCMKTLDLRIKPKHPVMTLKITFLPIVLSTHFFTSRWQKQQIAPFQHISQFEENFQFALKGHSVFYYPNKHFLSARFKCSYPDTDAKLKSALHKVINRQQFCIHGTCELWHVVKSVYALQYRSCVLGYFCSLPPVFTFETNLIHNFIMSHLWNFSLANTLNSHLKTTNISKNN